MEAQFEFLIPNRKARWLGIMWFTMLFAVPFLLLNLPLLTRPYRELIFGTLFTVELILMVGPHFFLPWLVRKYLSDPTCYSVCADRFSMLNQKTGVERQWLFANVVSYYVLLGKTGAELSLKLTDGKRHLLHCPDFDFLNFTRVLDKAIRFYEQEHGLSSRKKQDFSFFEAPVSTGFLWFYAFVMGLMVWGIGIPEPSTPGFFMLFFFGLGFMLYFIAWFSARKARRNY